LVTLLVVTVVAGGFTVPWLYEKQREAELEKDPAYREQKRQEKADEEERAALWRERMRVRAEEIARRKQAEAAAAAVASERDHNKAAAEAARQREADARAEANEQAALAREAARQNPEYKIGVEDATLYKKGGADVVLSADLDIRNDNDFPVTNVIVRCTLYDRSRIETDSYAMMIASPIDAHASRMFPNVKTALFADDSAHASCTVAAAAPL
jgi:hypothetical protein